MDHVPKRPPATSTGKKAYSAPRLTRYGSVDILVQTGTMGPAEPGPAPFIPAPFRMARMASDRAIKENIVRIGEHPMGIGLYLFDYRAEFRDAYGHGRQFGVMADEVRSVVPEAVSIGHRGHAMVNYAMLAVRRSIDEPQTGKVHHPAGKKGL